MMEEQMDVAAVIAAEVEETASQDARFEDMDRRIRELEAAIGDMRTVSAQAAPVTGRRTAVSAAMAASAKGEIAGASRVEALDATLGSLSVEQRIAVKSGMMRAGLL